MRHALLLSGLLASTAAVAGDAAPAPRSFVQAEADIAVVQPGPHEGTGTTTAFPFFAAEPGLGFVFRKRILPPGASIGSHRNDKDEIYYVLSGEGELELQGERRRVRAGDAILTRNGHTHGLRAMGASDLVIFVVYPTPIAATPP
jgi:quercetin dioxygenase-like cupin family protein